MRTRDDVDFGLQPDPAHADRLAHILAVDDELLGLDQQQALIGRNIDGFGGFNHARHIGLRDFLVLDGNHAAGIDAANMAARDAGIDPRDLAVGH